MATLATTSGARLATAPVVSVRYERWAGACALVTGALTLVYSVAFVFLVNETLTSVCLLVNGLLGTAVLIALYERLRTTDGSFALWALVLGLAGALGSALHGGYDLAGVLHAHGPVDANLASATDPRGLLTFGVSGVSLWVMAWLMGRDTTAAFPKALGYVGYVLAALQIVLYVGRLVVFDAANPLIIIPALLAGFLIAPVWYVWLGLRLWRSGR